MTEQRLSDLAIIAMHYCEQRRLKSFHPSKSKNNVSGPHCFWTNSLCYGSQYLSYHSIPMIFDTQHASIPRFRFLPICFNNLFAPTFAFEYRYMILLSMHFSYMHIFVIPKKLPCFMLEEARPPPALCYILPPFAIFCPPLLYSASFGTKHGSFWGDNEYLHAREMHRL